MNVPAPPVIPPPSFAGGCAMRGEIIAMHVHVPPRCHAGCHTLGLCSLIPEREREREERPDLTAPFRTVQVQCSRGLVMAFNSGHTLLSS